MRFSRNRPGACACGVGNGLVKPFFEATGNGLVMRFFVGVRLPKSLPKLYLKNYLQIKKYMI